MQRQQQIQELQLQIEQLQREQQAQLGASDGKPVEVWRVKQPPRAHRFLVPPALGPPVLAPLPMPLPCPPPAAVSGGPCPRPYSVEPSSLPTACSDPVCQWEPACFVPSRPVSHPLGPPSALLAT